jgi:hypothetical protein
VTVQQTIELVKLLRGENIPFEFMIILNDVHDFCITKIGFVFIKQARISLTESWNEET